MNVPIYQIDAFTGTLFAGNPAAVCPLAEWLDDTTLLAIAAENNLSETAYLVDRGAEIELRWFTPVAEIDLCGHATLASGFLLLEHLRTRQGSVWFSTRSGTLSVTTGPEGQELDFPSLPPTACDPPAALLEGLGREPVETLAATNYLAIYDSEEEITGLTPALGPLATLHPRGVIASAPGRDVDFVSRFFAPSWGVPEDPATGSAHCTLTPYWSRRLGKKSLQARQLSRRGAELACEDRGERVGIAGRCVLYMEGTITLP